MLSRNLFIFRNGVKHISHAFPVSLACHMKHYSAAKVMLINLYCSEKKCLADWHGIGIHSLSVDWLTEIIQYKKLLLDWNNLRRLPNEICWLVNLVQLNLQHNYLEAIPSGIFTLPKLTKLDISFNCLKELPSVDQWSSSLNVLNVQGNLLQSFPENIRAVNMQYLNLADNHLATVPGSVCCMTSLISLDISGNNNIRMLPLQLGKLSHLFDLKLSGLQVI